MHYVQLQLIPSTPMLFPLHSFIKQLLPLNSKGAFPNPVASPINYPPGPGLGTTNVTASLAPD